MYYYYGKRIVFIASATLLLVRMLHECLYVLLPPPLGHIGLVIGTTKTKEGEISKNKSLSSRSIRPCGNKRQSTLCTICDLKDF